MEYQTPEQPNAVQYKSSRKKRKRKRRLKILKRLLLFMLLFGGLAAFGLSSLFAVQDIAVTGVKHYTKEQIALSIDKLRGENAFRSIAAQARTRSHIGEAFLLRYGQEEDKLINTYPYIRDVKVSFRPMRTIRVKVTEREPAYVCDFMGAYLLMDQEGYGLEVIQSLDKISLIEIKGLKLEGMKPGKKIRGEDEETLQAVNHFNTQVQALEKAEGFKMYPLIKMIDVSDPDQLIPVLKSNLKVNFGDLKNLEYNIKFFKEIYQKNLKDKKSGTLDFTAGQYPLYKPE